MWSAEEERYLREHYPTESQCDIADYLGVSPGVVLKKVRELGLKKDSSWDRNAYNKRYTRNYVHHYKDIAA